MRVKRTNIYTSFFVLSAIIGLFRLALEKPAQSSTKDLKALTVEQLAFFLPDELKNLKKSHVRLMEEDGAVLADYGNGAFVLTIADAAGDNYQAVEAFNNTYYKTLTSENLVRFPKVRNGYKTITEIRDETTISFVLNKRFIVTIRGLDKQAPARLWSYLELSKLKPLDKFH